MDTSLNTDTLHGVQPTLINSYLLSNDQLQNDRCVTQFLGVNCSVDNHKESVVDDESILFGLDRKISKQEPPQSMLPKPLPKKTSASKVSVSSFQPFEPISTRVKRPSNILSGISIDRFEYPISSPQDSNHIIIDETYRGGFQTRMNTKDCIVNSCGNLLKIKNNFYGSMCE